MFKQLFIKNQLKSPSSSLTVPTKRLFLCSGVIVKWGNAKMVGWTCPMERHPASSLLGFLPFWSPFWVHSTLINASISIHFSIFAILKTSRANHLRKFTRKATLLVLWDFRAILYVQYLTGKFNFEFKNAVCTELAEKFGYRSITSSFRVLIILKVGINQKTQILTKFIRNATKISLVERKSG